MFSMKYTSLFFLEVLLVILPAFAYGVPILPTVPQGLLEVPLVDDLNLLPEELDPVVPKVPLSKIEPVDIVDKVQVPLTEKLLQEEKKLPAFAYGVPIIPTVPQGLLEVPLADDLNLLPEELDPVVPKVPLSKIEPVDIVDKVQVPLTKKLLQEEKKPLDLPVEVQQLPLVDNVNFLPEKPNEAVPLAVVATFLHIDNVQVIIPGKLLEKIFSHKPQSQGEKLEGLVTEQLSLVTVDSLPQFGDADKLEKPLSPLAVIASIPQIGNIQLVFSGELLKNILSKTLIPSVPVESTPEVVDDTVLTLEEIVPEKPFLLVPAKSLPEVHDTKVDNVLPEELDVVLLKKLPVDSVESKPQTVVPGLLKEEPLLLVPGKLALQTGKEELLDKLPSKELLSLDPLKSKLNIGNAVVLPGVVEHKPLPLIPVPEGQDGNVLLPVELPSGVVNEISNLLPAVPTFTPLLELSTPEILPLANKE